MNQKTRELWAECVIRNTKVPMNWQDVADDFSKQIVLQCANLILNHPDLRDVSSVRLFCSHTIKQHFEE